MGNSITRTDFEWSKHDEPHAKRRIEILSKHQRENTQLILASYYIVSTSN